MSLVKFNRSMFPDWPDMLKDDFFGRNVSQLSFPPANILEEENGYKVTLAVPGMDKKNFDVQVKGNLLSISTKREEQGETKDENYTKKEYSFATFERSFSLPENSLPTGIEANYENGELIIRIPKKELKTAAKQIEVA